MEHLFAGIDQIKQAWHSGKMPIDLIRQAIKVMSDEQKAVYLSDPRQAPVKSLIHQRAVFFDALLSLMWERLIKNDAYSLIAIGGYGRREQFPFSDIDVLILCPNIEAAEQDEHLSQFIRHLWDLGMTVGSSVREIEHCQVDIQNDINFATAVLEIHQICGSVPLFEAFTEAVKPGVMLTTEKYLQSKLEEQQKRYSQYEDTGYSVEPNIKECPGGLRDIQMIVWIAKFHFYPLDSKDLVVQGYLTEDEYKSLNRATKFLWNVRFGLHLNCGRDENRLLFEHQRALSKTLHYEDTNTHLGVEHFMHRCYKTLQEVQLLNELIVKYFRERLLSAQKETPIEQLNRRFQISRNQIETRNDKVFQYARFALLEIFLLLQKNPSVDGISAKTIREIRHSLYLIDDDFRNDTRHRSLFIELLRQPKAITRVFMEMNKLGVLESYIPAFAQIKGLMQFDLFHTYTVDAHTMLVLRNVRRMFSLKYKNVNPTAYQVSQTIPKPEVLYIACLFHDIAKGRGGRHEILGADDVEAFAQHHYLSKQDVYLCSWLVRNHLVFSNTAQKKDINDPRVIEEFSLIIPNTIFLDSLFLLTVADVQATSKSLWNNFKNTLFTQLWKSTRQRLLSSTDQPINEDILLENVKDETISSLLEFMPFDSIQKLWQPLTPLYFLSHRPEQLLWHTLTLHNNTDDICIALRTNMDQTATELMIYTKRQKYQFSTIIAALDVSENSVLHSTVIRTLDHHVLLTFTIQSKKENRIIHEKTYKALSRLIRTNLQALNGEDLPDLPPAKRLADRRSLYLNIETKIVFTQDAKNNATVMMISCRDRPSLLSLITRQFNLNKVLVVGARIQTSGARVDDIFTITDVHGQPIKDAQFQAKLRDAIKNQLDQESA